MKDIKEAWVTS